MGRLCERPGCSVVGTVSYGMVPEELVFWLAPLAGDDRALCRRHADAMVVPRGWTLEDRREPTPRLFPADRYRSATDETPAAAQRRQRRRSGAGQQLVIDGTGEIERPAVPEEPAAAGDAHAEHEARERAEGEPAITDRWVASFDASDDLDGVLAAESPLLARAFRGDRRR